MRYRRRSSSNSSSSRRRRRAVTSDPTERGELWEEMRRFNDANSGWSNKTAWEKFLIIQLFAKGVLLLTLFACAAGLTLVRLLPGVALGERPPGPLHGHMTPLPAQPVPLKIDHPVRRR